MTYQCLSTTVEATQFDPFQQPWPQEIIRWQGVRPRDGSYGYIQTSAGQVHVMNGDFIVSSGTGQTFPCSLEVFKLMYEAI